MNEPWESYLRSKFPGFLLPHAAAEQLSEEEASNFMAALSGRSNALAVLRGASFLAPRMRSLLDFVGRVNEHVRSLPSTSVTERREWIGGFQGKLDVRSTTALYLLGRRTEFVTRTPRREFDLVDNVVLRHVCDRLIAIIAELRRSKAAPDSGWGVHSAGIEGTLRHLVLSTALRHVTSRTLDSRDLIAAQQARRPVIREAAEWHRAIHDHLDDNDPAKIARTIAAGALIPLESETRFEIATTIRLADALIARLPDWTVERALVRRDRADIVTLTNGSVVIEIFYNQAILDAGPTDRSVQHYLAPESRMRPDVTVRVSRAGQLVTALVVECKHSTDPSYIIRGFKEAVLYRHEYAPFLCGSVKAALVTSGRVAGLPRLGDEVIAAPWEAWPPEAVIDSLVDIAISLLPPSS